jgi:TIR domain
MLDGTAKPVIFISYSHKDREWLEFVASHFGPAVKHGVLTIWYDEKLNGGDEFSEEINLRLNGCSLCVLLVSRYSLASDYIMDIEMKQMRDRRDRKEAHIFPILITQTTPQYVDWLKKLNLKPANMKALQGLPVPEQNELMAKIVSEIVEIVYPQPNTASATIIANEA